MNVPPSAPLSEVASIAGRRDALFDHMLAAPADLDAAFEYAALSAREGDVEGAIATLERMLIFAPGLPRLQLELGVLYFRLEAYETAESYLRAALSAPDVPSAVRGRIGPYLAAIEERTAVDSLHGAIIVGGRYQTNANAAPESRTITLNGIDFLLSDAALSHADTNAFATASLRYRRDLGLQGIRFDANLLAYGTLQAERSELNTGLAELTFGPTLDMARYGFDAAEVGAYAILGGVLLDSDPYLASAGFGSVLAAQLSRTTRFVTRAEFRSEHFRDSDLRPTSSRREGERFRGLATLEHRLTPRLALSATIQGERRNADADYLALWQAGVSSGLTYRMKDPFARDFGPWKLSISGGFLSRRYDEPDPVFSTSDVQSDRELFLQGAVTVPLQGDWAIQNVVGYRDVSSNYALRDFDNVSVSLGLMRRF